VKSFAPLPAAEAIHFCTSIQNKHAITRVYGSKTVRMGKSFLFNNSITVNLRDQTHWDSFIALFFASAAERSFQFLLHISIDRPNVLSVIANVYNN